jgi:hypothetical protein
MKQEQFNKQTITLAHVLAVFAADVDIFLLQNEEQTGDNDKESFTHEEIRAQLHKTCEKMGETLDKLNFDINKPLDDLIINPLGFVTLN